jgi:GNAT superfamily N-acetyltransferase
MIQVRVSHSEADDLRSLEIYNAVWPHDAFALEDANAFKASLTAADDHVARLDGDDVGSAFTGIRPHRPDVVFAPITVLAEHRRRGVGTALYEAASAWTGARGLDAIEAFVDEDDAASFRFAEHRGFSEIERNGRLILDLTDLRPPEIAPPAGIEIVTWAERPELARGMYEVACEAYPDIPGQEEDLIESFEDWLEHDMSAPGDRPEATFVALAGGEVVGFAKFSLTTARPTTAYHDITGVKRRWRGRGIAGALKRAQIGWAKEAGYALLQTGNEVRNTPILRLNERLGYKAAPGRILLRGPLSAGA